MKCDASTYVKGYSIFSKGITLCGKPAIAMFRGTRNDGKVCDYARCADHADETARTLDRNAGGLWTWVKEVVAP